MHVEYWWKRRKSRVSNVKMNLRVAGRGSMDWIGLAQPKDQYWTLLNRVMSPWNP
jgi:hypothetical protein